MNSPEREEVSRQLAEELGWCTDEDGTWYQYDEDFLTRPLPDMTRDTLVGQRIRVRELEAVLRFFEDEEVSSHPAEFIDSWTAKVFSEKVRLALNSKGEKG